MSSNIWAHLADTKLKGYETNLLPSSLGYLINDINAPLREAVEFDEGMAIHFCDMSYLLIAMPLN